MKTTYSMLNTIYPLMALCNVLAIAPPHSFEIVPKCCSKKFKLYSSTILTVILGCYIYNLYGKFNNTTLKGLYTVIYIVDFASTIFLTIISSLLIFNLVLLRSETFKMILCNIERFDDTVRLTEGIGRQKFWIFFVLLHVIVFSTIIMDTIIWTNVFGFHMYAYYMPRNILWYQFNLAFFLILWLAGELERRFRKINSLLVSCARGVNSSFLIPSLLQEYSIVKRKGKPFYIKIPDTVLLKNIKFWYHDFVKLVQSFNCIFGPIILFAVLFNITNVVNYTLAIMYHVVQKTSSLNLRIEILVVSLLWIAAASVQTLLIAASGEGITNEASRITTICYTLLSEVPSLPKTDYGVALREELILLTEQTPSSHPKVSAAGCFEINLGMMGFIVASVTSYIIVAIQFM